MHAPRTEFDRKLLSVLERRVPLVRRPYEQIAAGLGVTESHLLGRLADMRAEGGVIREISGVFDLAALAYSRALAAFGVENERADAAGRIAAEHPGVSHCYQRTGKYNLWLTLAVSSKSALGLMKTADTLARLCGADSQMILPALRRYKLDARFIAEPDSAPEPQPPAPPAARSSAEQVRAVRALQTDLPNEPDPFVPLADKVALTADDLLVHGADFLSAGWMRRYAAAIRHRAAGARENLLAAWVVEPEKADRAGAICAKAAQVSHCYLRPPGDDWPYTLYTMIHGRDRAECERVVADLAASAGLGRRAELWTVAEFKKRRVRLFGDEEAEWEARHR